MRKTVGKLRRILQQASVDHRICSVRVKGLYAYSSDMDYLSPPIDIDIHDMMNAKDLLAEIDKKKIPDNWEITLIEKKEELPEPSLRLINMRDPHSSTKLV